MAESLKEREENGTWDTPDAKRIMSKFLCGLSKSAMSKVTIEDIEDVEIDKLENYKKAPGDISRKDVMSDEYRMDFPRRGKAVIINNKNFSPDLARLGFYKRSGTDIDAKRIGSRLKLLGFDVERRHDVTCSEIRSVFQRISREDHSDADCFVAVLLSHGENEKIYGVDGSMNLKEIFDYFQGDKCKTLAGKPKIFFIQACRGRKLDPGVKINVTDAQMYFDTPYPVSLQSKILIPNEADFLISFSTVPGYYSWRNFKNGSWFIQALVQVLDECGTSCEILKLLTKVNRVVAYDQRFESFTLPDDPGAHGMKQVPSFTSMLTKDLYFVPKT